MRNLPVQAASRVVAGFLSALVMLLGLTMPASASITGVNLTSSNATQTGVCPATVKFSGVVTGKQGDQFQYWFRYQINGVQTITTASAPVTIGASGTVMETFSLAISASSTSSSGNFVQMAAAAMNGVGTASESVAVPFSVTCQQAQAASVTLTSSDQNQSGPCPATVHFSGVVTGTPGTAFQYWYRYQINGAQTITNPSAAVTIPASGSVTETYQLPVPVSSMGVNGNFVQMAVAGMFGSGMAGESQSVPFAVTCSPIPAPSGIMNTTDVQVCGAHIFALVCAAMAFQSLALVWSWTPTSGYATIDGFNVYSVTSSGVTTLVSHESAGGGATGTVIPKSTPSQSFTGNCYVVRAYKGATESANSNTACIKGAGVIEPLSLSPTHAATLSNVPSAVNNVGLFLGSCDNVQYACVGWFDQAPPQGDWWFRGYLVFDQNSLAATHNVVKATLTMSMQDGNAATCLGAIGVPKAPWMNTTTPVFGDFSYNLHPVFQSGQVSVDVSSVVRDWATGARPDLGFVLKGTQEDANVKNSKSCFAEFSTPTLTVNYY